MRRLIFIGLCALGLSVYAVDYAPFASAVPPSTTMQSVNNTDYMTTGSAYSPAVYEVGSSAPSASSWGRGIRKSGFDDVSTEGDSEYDPNNPQFSPLGDALLPLLLMALAFMGVIFMRHRKSKIINHK